MLKFGQRLDERLGRGDRSKDAALHLDHANRGRVVGRVRGGAAILQQEAFVAQVVGVAHGGVHAHIRRDARQNEVANAARAQNQVQIGPDKRALCSYYKNTHVKYT